VKRFDVLSDDVLLDIFYFYAEVSSYIKRDVEAWQTLVHVCRRWRRLIFRSQRRLNPRLCCTIATRARDKLNIWPALPIVVYGEMVITPGTGNIIAALEHSNRICQVFLLDLEDWQLEEVLAEMQVPFPELTDLEL
jgi:hypothetical protein